MPIPEDAAKAGVRPAWMGYIGVDDVDVYAKRVKAAAESFLGAVSSFKGPEAFGLLTKGYRERLSAEVSGSTLKASRAGQKPLFGDSR